MLKREPTDRILTRLAVPTRWGLGAGLALTLAAGTTSSLAQDSGLSQFEDDYAAEEVFIEDFDSEELLPEFEPAPGEDAPRSTGDLNYDVSVSDYDLVDLHVNDEDLGRVLQLLSIQSERNIIASQTVEASVTADLYGVTFYEALDAILHVNGFGYIERGNFIYVYTREELEQIEQAARQRESRVIRLNYLNAIDAGEFAAQLLSDGGAITTNGEMEAFPSSGDAPVGADTYASGATLVVYDYPENIEAIEGLVSQIDVRPVQVLVEATILQTTLNEANAFGVDFAILNDMDFSDFIGIGGPLSAVNGLISGAGEDIAGGAVDLHADNGSALNTNIGNVAGPATFKAGIVNEDVAVFLRVLDQVTDVTVVSNPKILTLNRQAARVLVGTKVGYLNTTTTDTSTTQSVEFLDTGTQLSVRPFVSDSGVIRLELKPQVSSAQLREITDNGGNTVTIPDEDTTELTTNVQLRDGQTAVLGGLFTETTTATRRQVPVLGDIPLIGNAFRGHEDSTRRNEIIFMVTPSIVNDTMVAEAGELGNTYKANALMGAREGTLFWSRERQVGRLLIEARKHADAGDNDMAIYKVQKAIGLSPMSADARTMLEELTNEKHRRPSRSILEGALHRELLDPMPGVVTDGRWHRKNFISKPAAPAAQAQPQYADTYVPFDPATETFVVEEVPEPTTTETFVWEPGETESAETDYVETEAFADDAMTGTDDVMVEEFVWTAPETVEYGATEPAEAISFNEVEADPIDAKVLFWDEPIVDEHADTEPADVSFAEPVEETPEYIAPTPASGSWKIESLSDSGDAVSTEWVEMTADEQTGGHNADESFETFNDYEVATETEGSVLAPINVTADELMGQYDFEPLDNGYASADEAGGFSVPSEEVMDTIVWTSEETLEAEDDNGWIASAVEPEIDLIDPSESIAGQHTADGSSTRAGYLVVPLPGGGVVQMPWPMQGSSAKVNEPIRWREFSSVPVDRDGSFDK